MVQNIAFLIKEKSKIATVDISSELIRGHILLEKFWENIPAFIVIYLIRYLSNYISYTSMSKLFFSPIFYFQLKIYPLKHAKRTVHKYLCWDYKSAKLNYWGFHMSMDKMYKPANWVLCKCTIWRNKKLALKNKNKNSTLNNVTWLDIFTNDIPSNQICHH